MKIRGRNPRFEDFMPKMKPEKPNPRLAEIKMKIAAKALINEHKRRRAKQDG